MAGSPLSFDLIHPQPLLIVISGPSGVGKDSVVRTLLKRDLPLHFVVTATSREKRAAEVDGVDYIFITQEEFINKINRNEMLEYAYVYGQYKGVPKEQVRVAWKSGKDVIMRLDVQGSATIRRLYPQALLIFLLPTTEAELVHRLVDRKTESAESIQIRMTTTRNELESLDIFDYAVVNQEGKLEETADIIQSIIEAEHQRVKQRIVEL
jgi:guanylate kinase